MRVLILSATLLGLAACSTEDNLLAPDHEAERILSPEKPDTAKRGRAVDPVCGAPLDQANDTWHTVLDGTPYIFDSEACKRQFDQHPELYRSTVR